jgi:hypothetical protein
MRNNHVSMQFAGPVLATPNATAEIDLAIGICPYFHSFGNAKKLPDFRGKPYGWKHQQRGNCDRL